MNKNPRSKIKDEAVVVFETKEIRDHVKAQAHRLANHDDEVGMRLEIPNHLQKDFRLLMKLSYTLKKKHPQLKRSVKFDEEALGMYMDIQMRTDGNWSRIKPEQAKTAMNNDPQHVADGPAEMEAGDIVDLLVGDRPDDDETE